MDDRPRRARVRAREPRRAARRRSRAAVEEAALALGIAHLLDRPTAELSGGELQRVALGAALAGRPALRRARRADLAARSGRRRRADRAAAPLNEDCDTAILLAEHRLERCLACGRPGDRARRRPDRLRRRRPDEFLAWAPRRAGACDAGRAAAGGLGLRAGAGRQARPRGAARARAVAGSRADRAARSTKPEPPRARLRGWRRRRDRAPASRRSSSTASGTSSASGRRSCAASTLTTRARRAGRADGPQRRRQVDAAAPRRRADEADPRAGRAAGRVALLLQNPTTTSSTSAVARGGVRARRWRAVGLDPRASRSPPARPDRRREAAARAGDRARRPGRPSGRRCCASTSRPAAWTASARTQLAELLASARRAPSSSPPTTPSSRPRSPSAWCCSPTARVIADGPAHEVLTGGSYFATETARILGGAAGR